MCSFVLISLSDPLTPLARRGSWRRGLRLVLAARRRFASAPCGARVRFSCWGVAVVPAWGGPALVRVVWLPAA